MRRLTLCLLLTACAPDDDVAFDDIAVEEALSAMVLSNLPVSGCGDIDLMVHNQAATAALVMNMNGYATAAATAGLPLTGSVDVTNLPPGVSASLQLGRHLTAGHCSGAPPQNTPVVRRTYVPVRGTAFYTITPDASATASFPLATVRIELEDVRMRGTNPRWGRIDLPDIDTGVVSVGLYPP